MLEEEQETELRNPFPSPPSHYHKYTSHNLHLLSLLKQRTADKSDEECVQVDQNEVLKDQKDVPDWPLAQLEKPRVDWILEEGHYNVFGDTWFVKEKIPSLGELGGQQLYPDDPTIDRRPALLSILRSMLVTYSRLLKSLLSPPPGPTSTERPEWQTHVEWLAVMSQNIMSAANDLRPVQARFNLEMMMTRQLELRREEAAALHKKCDDLQSRLQELKQATSNMVKVNDHGEESSQLDENSHPPNMEDVLRWAEGE
ncbi:hypothetical protein A7U60_g2292 [Sanghuangporus baumii]|uniref:Mediator of RNA polymerase II transcription subunit 7 n=1 Tax=Sanghuangporus baumii TaxID=108892 RepID=A0A9Q5NE18_SANBA|nr:hypothetical protein A7U60_g2292 [Sanghuangporus baumii]